MSAQRSERTSSPRASAWCCEARRPRSRCGGCAVARPARHRDRRQRAVQRSPRRSPAIGARVPNLGAGTRSSWKRGPMTSSCRRRMTRARCSRRRSARAHLRAEAPVRPVPREPRPDGPKLGDVRVPNSCGSAARGRGNPAAGDEDHAAGWIVLRLLLAAALPAAAVPGPAPSPSPPASPRPLSRTRAGDSRSPG